MTDTASFPAGTLVVGAPLHNARSAVILLHGRGATATSMLPLAGALQPDGAGAPAIAFIIPQAPFNRWYPNSAFAPLAENQPDLDNALQLLNDLVTLLGEHGFAPERIVFGGFSQGACLASEFAARDARAFGGLFAFSGALIGPLERERHYAAAQPGLPVFIGGSDVDPWVAKDFLDLTAETFTALGAQVDYRIYPGMAHTVNEDELAAVQAMLVA